MFHEWDLTQEEFDRLLAWLHPDRDEAGLIYEAIRIRVRKTIAARGCPAADEIFAETVYRVARKLPGLAQIYDGNPALFFYGVANKVYKEYIRNQVETESLTNRIPAPDPPNQEVDFNCLEKCLNRLAPEEKKLVLRFYSEKHHILAEDEGLSQNALRLRLFRLRQKLFACMSKCLGEN